MFSASETVLFQNFTLQNQTFYTVDVEHHTSAGDFGIMGLSPRSLTGGASEPWWLRLVTSFSSPAKPLFALYLARFDNHTNAPADETQSNGGSMDLGFLNPQIYTGDIHNVPLVSNTSWLIPLGGVTINGNHSKPGGNALISRCVS